MLNDLPVENVDSRDAKAVGIGPVHKTPRTEPGQIVSGEAVLKKMQYKDKSKPRAKRSFGSPV